MRQDEHRTVLDGELEEGTVDLVAIDDPGDIVARIGMIDPLDRDVEAPTTGATRLVSAGVDEEPMEPGIELRAIAKAAQVAPGSDESVLDRILRRIPVAEDPSCDRVQAVVCGGRESIECLVVAPLRAFDELGRHRRPSIRRGAVPR